MKRETAKYVLLTVIFWLGGCVSDGEVVRVEPSETFHDKVDIRLIPYDVERADQFRNINWDHFIITGPYWTQVFSDSEEIDETFTIVFARMHSYGFSRSNYTYSVEGIFRCGGEEHPVKVEQTDEAFFKNKDAMRGAIEKTVASVATLATALAADCRANR